MLPPTETDSASSFFFLKLRNFAGINAIEKVTYGAEKESQQPKELLWKTGPG